MKKTYIIIGDSWGVGEWPDDCSPSYSEMPHRGLAQYLEEAGHQVYNLSLGGDSNVSQVSNLDHMYERVFGPANIKIDKIVAFKTEYTRDADILGECISNNITLISDLESRCNAAYYTSLSNLSARYNVPVVLIGGLSDTIWLEKFSEEYPGVTIGCQSVVNLLVNGNPRVDNPTYAVLPGSISVIDSIDKEGIIDVIDNARDRMTAMKTCPDLFWPDGSHPNRIGHALLFNYLQENELL